MKKSLRIIFKVENDLRPVKIEYLAQEEYENFDEFADEARARLDECLTSMKGKKYGSNNIRTNE